MLSVRGEIYVDWRGKEFKESGEAFAQNFVLDLTIRAEKYAKENVEPGRGPGPHPHRTPHEDTGALKESISADVDVQGSKVIGTVGSNLDYGRYLEVGWRAKSGKFYRYPWLWPAMHRAAREMRDVARAHKRVFFAARGKDVKFPWQGYVPPQAGWDPRVMRFRDVRTGRFVARDVWEALLRQFHGEP